MADITPEEMFPDGRVLYYEGDVPDWFARQIAAEFGFDPAADRRWGLSLATDALGEDMPDPLGRSYSFHCPAAHLAGVLYSHRFRVGS